MKRRSPRQGQSYVDANRGRLVSVDSDVLGYKREIETRWPELTVAYDEIDREWIIIELCRDHTERLVFTEKVLGQHTINRLMRADPDSAAHVDVLDEIDNHNAEVRADQERRFAERIGDFGERFLHALRKDGYMDHENVYGRPTITPPSEPINNRA